MRKLTALYALLLILACFCFGTAYKLALDEALRFESERDYAILSKDLQKIQHERRPCVQEVPLQAEEKPTIFQTGG
jgi:hypothetical protein